MNRRIGPRVGPLDKPVFHGVPMAIIDMGGEIRLVPDAMLPKPPLPNATFAFSCLAGTYMCGV